MTTPFDKMLSTWNEKSWVFSNRGLQCTFCGHFVMTAEQMNDEDEDLPEACAVCKFPGPENGMLKR